MLQWFLSKKKGYWLLDWLLILCIQAIAPLIFYNIICVCFASLLWGGPLISFSLYFFLYWFADPLFLPVDTWTNYLKVQPKTLISCTNMRPYHSQLIWRAHLALKVFYLWRFNILCLKKCTFQRKLGTL